MNKRKTTKTNEPIKFETVYPIAIREKDGALSFNLPGEPFAFEESETVKSAMLAHKLNEVIVELHKLQRVAFVNNALIADMKSTKGRNDVSKDTNDNTKKQ
jgi:hypothetical protein